jgi:hypothetical protein
VKGKIFSARHSFSHCRYAGYEIDTAHTPGGPWQAQSAPKTGKSCSEQARASHASVASALLLGIGARA